MSFTQALVKMKENIADFNDSKTKLTPIAKVAPEVKHSADADTEITKACAVLGCEDSKNLEADSFFRFPEEPTLRQIWTDLTGRNNWTPTDYSYICVQHFSVDCFMCDEDGNVLLSEKAVPSLKLPGHVLEVEYIDEETLDHEHEDFDMESDAEQELKTEHHQLKADDKFSVVDNIELVKLFTEVQKMQRQAVGLKDKLKCNMRMHNRQTRYLERLKDIIEIKKNVLSQKRKRKSRILLSLKDKIKDDANGLVMAMPTKHTDDLKNFALSIYKYSPLAYIYIRNTLRTMLPNTDILEGWLSTGFEPKNVLQNSNLIKVVSEQSNKELSCRVTLG